MSTAEDKGGRPYVKPYLREIELAGDEVLSTGCKTGILPPTTGDNSNGPPNCFFPTACNADGS
ncbi:MAG: hypothetical protein QGI24_10255 [Kiritimatiellia bacterium]|jgi:hypothetical protein|nr:hypothetical protein [Kiritimatiellia bacterium]MDP6849155.1 hypothetical protein [Kiritimatiellia bacterium]